MIYDRLGVPIAEGAILYCISQSCRYFSLVVATRLIVGDASTDVYGSILEWRWGRSMNNTGLWSRVSHGILPDYEIVGWCHR